MAKVFLGVGHGGNDPGAVKYLREEDVNLNMAIGAKEFLEKNGVEVKMSRYKDENDDLNEEIKECNKYNPDLAVDIHNNAGGGDGFECFYHHNGGNSFKLAKNIESQIKAIGQNSRGCKVKLNSKGNADYYGFIRLTNAPAVITEGVFVDNINDVKIVDTVEEQKRFGEAIGKGILETLIQMGLHNLKPNIKYEVHVQNIGWQEEKENGELAGTEGQALRIEAVKIHADIPIQYRVHMADKGWGEYVPNSVMAGTIGESRRIEAIEIISSKNPIKATAHIEGIGDTYYEESIHLIIGTEGRALRLEALRLEFI